MGQKVNPVGFRLGVNRGWDSVWILADLTVVGEVARDEIGDVPQDNDFDDDRIQGHHEETDVDDHDLHSDHEIPLKEDWENVLWVVLSRPSGLKQSKPQQMQ